MIRHAKIVDLDCILESVNSETKYMRDTGNATQWAGNYPERQDFLEDIEKQHLYVCYNEEMIYGVFFFLVGEEPNYAHIEDGEWLNHEPYGVIHRVAGNGKVKGIFREIADFAKKQADNLRIDTHENNRTMQHVIEKNGFQKCGIVYVEDGTPRIAYQYTAEK